MAKSTLTVRPAQTWDAWVAQAARRQTEPSKGSCDGRKNTDAWSGASYGAALNMAQHGWQAGAANVAALLDTLPAAEEVLPDWTMEVAGAMPCVPAYLSGDPECMFSMRANARPDRRITLAVPATCSANIGADSMLNYARAVAAVVRSLDASGVSVAVYRLFAGEGNHTGRLVHGHAVREHGEPLDLGKIAFAFHPAAFRRLTFCWLDVDDVAYEDFANGGRGRVLSLTGAIVRDALPDIGQCVIFPEINDLDFDGLLRDRALSRLIARLRQTVASAIEATG